MGVEFYVMGTMGLRAGIRAGISVGLISTKLASVGFAAEAVPMSAYGVNSTTS